MKRFNQNKASFIKTFTVPVMIDYLKFQKNSLLLTIESLTDDEKIFCERALTKKELWKTLQTFKIEKNPGNDGLIF